MLFVFGEQIIKLVIRAAKTYRKKKLKNNNNNHNKIVYTRKTTAYLFFRSTYMYICIDRVNKFNVRCNIIRRDCFQIAVYLLLSHGQTDKILKCKSVLFKGKGDVYIFFFFANYYYGNIA